MSLFHLFRLINLGIFGTFEVKISVLSFHLFLFLLRLEVILVIVLVPLTAAAAEHTYRLLCH